MKGYSFFLTCPTCGDQMEHRRSATVAPDRGWCETWCEACLIVWRIDLCATAIENNGPLISHSQDRARERAADACSDERLSQFK